MGTLMYNSEWNRLELDGDELQTGDRVEIFVFGYWILDRLLWIRQGGICSRLTW